MSGFSEEIVIRYPCEWEERYKANALVPGWVKQYPDQFEAWMGSTRKGTLELFDQNFLMYLLRNDLRVLSVTWLNLCSDPWRSKNQERTLKNWDIMRQRMGHDRFGLLQRALKDCGFCDFNGEPDLFCWQEGTGSWFLAEAKAKRDQMQEVQRKWARIYRSVLSDAPDIRVYRLLPEQHPRSRAQAVPNQLPGS